MNKSTINKYFDYAASNPIRGEVLNVMKQCYKEHYANPSSRHILGVQAKEILEANRKNIAKILNCDSNEIYFTSGSTESINLAIQGIVRANKSKDKKRIISSSIEHSAALTVLNYLKDNEDMDIIYIKPNKDGHISPQLIESNIKKNKTALVNMIYVHNELGTIEPIKEIADICKKYNVPLHIDASQAPNMVKIDVKKIGIDLMTISGYKLHGPKGIGCLYIRSGTEIAPLIMGGGQEKNVRGGTENLPGIVGFNKALEIAQKNAESNYKKTKIYEKYLIERINKLIPEAFLIGNKNNKVPNINYFVFPKANAEIMVEVLSSRYGICLSAGSACANNKPEPSKLLTELDIDKQLRYSGVRISFNEDITFKKIDYLVNALKESLDEIINISPQFN